MSICYGNLCFRSVLGKKARSVRKMKSDEYGDKERQAICRASKGNEIEPLSLEDWYHRRWREEQAMGKFEAVIV